jgi:chorismate mutase
MQLSRQLCSVVARLESVPLLDVQQMEVSGDLPRLHSGFDPVNTHLLKRTCSMFICEVPAS